MLAAGSAAALALGGFAATPANANDVGAQQLVVGKAYTSVDRTGTGVDLERGADCESMGINARSAENTTSSPLTSTITLYSDTSCTTVIDTLEPGEFKENISATSPAVRYSATLI